MDQQFARTPEEIADGLKLSDYDDDSGELHSLLIDAVNQARETVTPKHVYTAHDGYVLLTTTYEDGSVSVERADTPDGWEEV